MAVTLLQIARVFATKVPGKIDADVLQLLWKVSDYLFLQISCVKFTVFWVFQNIFVVLLDNTVGMIVKELNGKTRFLSFN